MWIELATSLERGRERTLARRATRLGDLVRDNQNSTSAVIAARYHEFADATPEGSLIHLYDGDGRRLLPASDPQPAFRWPPLSRSGERYDRASQDGRLFLVLSRATSIGGRHYVIRVAGQLEDNRQLLAIFTTGLIAATPALLLISAFAGYLLSRRALRPVDRLTLALRTISIGNLSERLPVQPTGDELHRLAATCNEMLARLENAVARINRFTADASHELRSPISFIRTVAEYGLRNPELDAESRQGFEEIVLETEQASCLLEDMLTLARGDAGGGHAQFEPVNLSDVLNDVCDKGRPAAQKKLQRLTLSLNQSQNLMVQGDRLALRRLIWTLLDNAIKYTPERGCVRLEAEASLREVRVMVRDNGIGIPADVLPRVFDRFFRADDSRGQTEGTGLGLAIAKWIADCHRATLTVESSQGRGSLFSVSFPAAS
jgi:signal transduction histidine kinase